jgi:hypothetical protein
LPILDLSAEEAQYFIDVTGARAISGYSIQQTKQYKTWFLCQDEDDLIEIVEELHQNSMRFANCSISDYIIKI